MIVLTLPILRAIRDVEGWLADDEADLLVGAAQRAACTLPADPFVEIGSYCGKSTIAIGSVLKALGATSKLYAVDPHEGQVGADGVDLHATAPTLARLRENLRRSELDDHVEIVKQRSYEVEWSLPVAFLFVDGLHDYDSVARDLRHFEPFLRAGALVAFHDYADYYPGVVRLVNEVVQSGEYRWVARASSLAVLQRKERGARESATP